MTINAKRRMRFEYPDNFAVAWTPELPEFACAANSVSMLMPHVEPMFVRAIRQGAAELRRRNDLSDELAIETTAYLRQEAGHHAQHRRFNDLLVTDVPLLGRIDRAIAFTVRHLERRWGRGRHGVTTLAGLVAGGEAVAYAIARWTEPRIGTLLRGADPDAAQLYLWHLAEEVEHKSVAFDVFTALGGKRRTYLLGLLTLLTVLSVFVVMGTTLMLAKQRRLWNPVAWWRLTCWALSFLFEAVPEMIATAIGRHHPSDLCDPAWFALYLQGIDLDAASAA